MLGALASSAASSIVNAATSSISTASSNQAEQIIAQAASSASSIASQAIAKTTNNAILDVISQSDEPKYAFLPLMMTSIYCAIGVVWVWFSLSARFLRGTDDFGDEDVRISDNKKNIIQRTNIPNTTAKTFFTMGSKMK